MWWGHDLQQTVSICLECLHISLLQSSIRIWNPRETHEETLPSCCKYGINMAVTAELRVWLEVPDTAWWLQLPIPIKQITHIHLTCSSAMMHRFWACLTWQHAHLLGNDCELPFRACDIHTILASHLFLTIKDTWYFMWFTPKDLEKVRNNVLNSTGIAALMRQVLHRLDGLLHQLRIVRLHLAWDTKVRNENRSISLHLDKWVWIMWRRTKCLTCNSLPNIHGVLTEVECNTGEQARNGWKNNNNFTVYCIYCKIILKKHYICAWAPPAKLVEHLQISKNTGDSVWILDWSFAKCPHPPPLSLSPVNYE